MGSVKIEKLGGMLPAWDDRFLPDNQAAFARNTFLYSGAGIGWRMPKLLRALTNSAAKYAYRVPTTSQAIAAANLLFKTNVIAGDTVTLGEIIYTFRASPSAQYDVLLGADVLTSARALFTAACFGPYDTAVVGAGTPANPAIASDVPYFGFPFSFNSPGNNTQPANSIILVPFTAPATMQVTAINCVPQTSNASAKFTGVVYENVYTLNAAGTAYQNTPTSLSATGAQVVGCTAGSTLTSTLATPITLQQGSVYWFGFIIDSAIAFTKASTSTLGVSNTNTYSGGPPNPFQQTTISGATVAGTSVGTLQTTYNQNQPTWQIWGSMAALQTLDAENTIGTVTFASVQYNYLGFQAPSFGASFNQTPVAESTAGARVSWLADLASVNDTTAFFVGGVNQTLDATPTGAGTWLEFLDQDTNVVRTPVVGDSWQRYYYASPSLPPQYNTAARIAAGSPSWILGVPAPPNAPTLSTLSGGNPTQIGFPNSANSQSLNLPANTLFNSLLVLYPVRSTSAQQLNDVAIQLNALTGSDSIEMQGVRFQDASGTGGTANTPGDLIAFGGIVQAVASGFTPGPLTSFFSVGPTLLANTLYWMGAIIWVVGNSAKVGLGDNFSQGSSANLGNSLGNDPSSPTGMGFTKNPKTGFFQAPAMSANYPDLQLWGDFVANAGAAQEETRAYAYTWVTAYGEEGPPSPPALLTAFDNATWTVGLQPPLAEDMGTLRNIVRTNIYRTMASVQGGTVYFYVGTVTATATTFVDHITDDVVSLNSILPSTTWYGPPATLQGLISMPNGMIAGFRANEVWFCEPFRPHAWPAQYVLTTV